MGYRETYDRWQADPEAYWLEQAEAIDDLQEAQRSNASSLGFTREKWNTQMGFAAPAAHTVWFRPFFFAR